MNTDLSKQDFGRSILNFQDLPWHHKMCQYAHHPHPNVLPAMPERKKGTKQTENVATENGKDTVEKVPIMANGPSTVVTSPSVELTEAGGGGSSKSQECSTVSDKVTSS